MDQVLTYDKSLLERLQEYKHIFTDHHMLSLPIIKEEWSLYLEFTMDHSGWQAIWKVPRLTCERLKLPFPIITLVYVENTDFLKQVAVVTVLSVLYDIDIPARHVVPLVQLWPTKEQDKTVALNLQSTANALDTVRFFYTKLYMPWDDDEDVSVDWFANHLESRLRLFYDMKNGVIPQKAVDDLHSLLAEAKHLQAKREQIQEAFSELDLEDDKLVERIAELQVRIIEIQNSVELLENPLWRNILLQREQWLEKKEKLSVLTCWLVHEESTIDEQIKFIEQVNLFCSNKTVQYGTTLMLTLEVANSGDTLILDNKNHLFKHLGALGEGGCLRGVNKAITATVTSVNQNIIFDVTGCVVLENLVIDATAAQCAVLVRQGNVSVKNCKIIGDATSSTRQGFIVLAGGSLELVDCAITGFAMAIVGNSKSEITLKNCEIYDSIFGLKVYDNCKVNMECTSFNNCRLYGVCVETDKEFGSTAGCGFAVLTVVPGITANHITGENNGEADVMVNQKLKLLPLDDVFSHPNVSKLRSLSDSDYDGTMNSEDGGDLNDTVVEYKSVDVGF